ncbi:MAG: glutathione S-transferase family protein, partial [Sphingomonadales bacterium]
TPVLTEDDPLRDWIDRGFDLYGGLGRHPGLHPLFGLELREGDPEPFVKQAMGDGLASRNTGPESTKAETARLRGQAA